MSRPSHAEACRAFRWDDTLRSLGWAPGGRVDLARTIVDRHAGTDRPAIRWVANTGASRTLTFDELGRASGQVAGWLRSRGLREGDRVAGLLPRVPETIAIMLGTWKAGGVYVPIFTGFGPDAVEFRLRDSGAAVLCTHWEHRAQVPASLPGSMAVLTISGPGTPVAGDADFHRAVAGQPADGIGAARRREDPAVILYTSGSTGPPKGVQIAANFLAAVHPWMVYGVDLRPDDVFWPTGDPGWGYGLICYMLALAMGVPVTCHEAPPAAEYVLRRISLDGVTNLATTPTLLRGIMALPAETLERWPVRLRAASSCGEPLNGEVVTFFRRHWGVTVMDHYGASEFGLPIGNCNALEMEVRPGSMGLPLPGSTMAIVDDDGREASPDTVGHIAMRPHPEGYYSLGYWGDAGRTAAMSRGGWLTIGDLGRRDGDGYFWFEGRDDDVIKSSGYRIGPFEVESAILRHPAVAEAAVVGAPDALRGQIVKAFVVLRQDQAPSPGLRDEIVALVKSRLGRHQYPREVEFVHALPKTETGKIQRFQLRAGLAPAATPTPSQGDTMAAFEAITGPGPWPARYTFSPAVRAGNLLFISGTTATDERGELVAPGDIVQQTRVILGKFQRLLEAAGGGMEHIVQTTEYVTTTDNYRKTAEVRREFFRAPYPTATGVIVAGLLREGAVIEISAIAVLPG